MSSDHAGDELVDLFLTVAPCTSLVVGMSLLFKALEWGGQFEWPEEVVSLLEMRANSPDLVDKILNTGNAVSAQCLVNDGVVIERNSAAVNLTEATTVDKFGNSAAGGVTVGDEGFDVADHVPGCTVESHEDTVVKLTESEKLHDLLLLGGKLVDTSDSDDKCNLGLGFDEEISSLFGASLGINECLVSGGVLTGVLLSVLGGDGSLGSTFLLCGFTSGFLGSQKLGITGRLLLDVFWYNSCPKTHQQMS